MTTPSDDATVSSVHQKVNVEALDLEAPLIPADDSVSTVQSTLRLMFRRDGLYLLGGFLPLAVNGLVTPLVTRLVGPEQYGAIALSLAISQALWYFLPLGLQYGIQREFALRGPLAARGTVALGVVSAATMGAVLALTYRLWAGAFGASSFPWAMQLAALWGCAAAITLLCVSLLRSADRLFAFGTVILIQAIASQILGISLVLLLHHGAKSYLTGVVIGQSIALCLALAVARPRMRGLLDVRSIRTVLSFSLPLLPQQLSLYVFWAADRIIVQHDLGTAATARYAVAYTVGSVTLIFLGQINQAWMPRIFGIQDVELRSMLLHRANVQLNALLKSVMLSIALLLPLMLILVAPSSYHPRSLLFVSLLVLVGAMPYSRSLANSRSLLGDGRTKRLAVGTLASALVNITLNIVLIPPLGIRGSALAMLVSWWIMARVTDYLVRDTPDRIRLGRRETLGQALVIGACLLTGLIPQSALLDVVRLGVFCPFMILTLHRLRRMRSASTIIEGEDVTGLSPPVGS